MLSDLHAWPAVALVSVALPIVLAAAGGAPAGPMTLTPAQREAVTREIEKDRADTEQWLKSDISSYLATVDRRDFETYRIRLGHRHYPIEIV